MAIDSSPKKTSVGLHLVEGGASEFGAFGNIHNSSRGKALDYEDMYNFLKMSPEVMGITQAVCDDLMGGGPVEWTGSDSAVKAAKEWSKRNHFKKRLYSGLQDYVLTGDGYLGTTVLTQKKFLQIFDGLRKAYGLTSPNRLFHKIRSRDNSFLYPRELFVLKTTTITIDYDKHGRIKWFVQKVPGISQPVKFSPDEVIHLSLNNLGHDVYGNSPFWSCLNEMASLWYAKDYAGMFFQNDGTPDKIYKFPDENPKSANVKKFVRQLKEFKKAKKKHSSMVITGNVGIESLNDFNKDLEFPSLISVFTERLMMAWNMPPTRLASLSGNYRSALEATDGYYKKINRIQSELEETLNNELWWRFGNVEMRFPRVYKRDESREADIVSRLVGRPVWTGNEGREYLGGKPIKDPSMDVVAEKASKALGRSQEDKLPEETGNQFMSSAEKKMFSKDGSLLVNNFDQFIAIVEQTDIPFNRAKVFVDELEDSFVFYFSDDIWAYRCELKKRDKSLYSVNDEDFYQKFLSGAIKVKGNFGGR